MEVFCHDFFRILQECSLKCAFSGGKRTVGLSQHISLAGLCESALADKLGYGP